MPATRPLRAASWTPSSPIWRRCDEGRRDRLGDARRPRIVRADGGLPGPRLKEIWETAPGLVGWLGTVDHKEIGLRYIVTAFVFLVLGGLEALVMRVQLAGPDRGLLTPEPYDQLFTMHGVTMIFLYAVADPDGLQQLLWPLLLGARDMAFPRLNALSYWIYLVAGLFIYAGFVVGAGPNDGWFNYVPYAARPTIRASTSTSMRSA